MEVLFDHRVAFGLEGEELEDDIDLSPVFFFELLELPVEEKAVGAQKIRILDDADGRTLETVTRPGGPAGRKEAGIGHLGQAVIFPDDLQGHAAELGVFLGFIKALEPVGSGQCQDGENSQKLDGGKAPGQAVSPEEEEAEQRKYVIAGAKEAERLEKEDGINEKADDPQRVKERQELVGPFKGRRGQERAQDDQEAGEQPEIAHRDTVEMGDRGIGRAVAIEKGADIAEGPPEYGFREIGVEEVPEGQDRGGDHAGPGEEAPEPAPAGAVNCQ